MFERAVLDYYSRDGSIHKDNFQERINVDLKAAKLEVLSFSNALKEVRATYSTEDS